MENNITMEVLSEQAMATVAVEPAVTPVAVASPRSLGYGCFYY